MGSVLTLYDWKTPCSGYKPESIGNFHVVRNTIPKGTVLSVDAMSIDAVMFGEPTKCTVLREGERDAHDTKSIWMSDTPKEHYMMWELVVRAKGDVLVGGLGLGLLVHLLHLRRDIGRITVAEKSPEVVQLVKKYMPEGVEVICEDFIYQVQKLAEKGVHYDTIISDMWKAGGDEEKELIEDCQAVIDDCYPNALQLCWALQEELDNDTTKMGILLLNEEERKRFHATAMRALREDF